MWSIIAASVVDLPEPVVPVSRMIPRSSSASWVTISGRPSSSTDLITTGIARMTIETEPRWRNALTRKRPRPSTAYEKSTSFSDANSSTLVVVVEHLTERALRVLGIQPLGVRNRLKVAVQPDERVRGDLQVKVGALGGDEVAQRVIKIKSHVLVRIGNAALPLEPQR